MFAGEALQVADHGARIVVITSGASVDSAVLHDAVYYAVNKGALVVAAATLVVVVCK